MKFYSSMYHVKFHILKIDLPAQYVHPNLEYLDQPKVQLRCHYCIDVT